MNRPQWIARSSLLGLRAYIMNHLCRRDTNTWTPTNGPMNSPIEETPTNGPPKVRVLPEYPQGSPCKNRLWRHPTSLHHYAPMHQPMHQQMHVPASLSDPDPIRSPFLTYMHFDYTILLLNLSQKTWYFMLQLYSSMFKSHLAMRTFFEASISKWLKFHSTQLPSTIYQSMKT